MNKSFARNIIISLSIIGLLIGLFSFIYVGSSPQKLAIIIDELFISDSKIEASAIQPIEQFFYEYEDEFEESLQNNGYEVHILRKFGKIALLEKLDELTEPLFKRPSSDTIVVYYLGHGDRKAISGYDGLSISAKEITDSLNINNNDNFILISEACYGGVFLRRIPEITRYYAHNNTEGTIEIEYSLDVYMQFIEITSVKCWSKYFVREYEVTGSFNNASIFATKYWDT